MYHTTTGTVTTECGEEITICVQHVDISPEAAEMIFDRGRQVGDWGWKHQIWECATITDLMETQAAARFYYGWSEGSETITPRADGGFTYEAYYAC